MSQEDGLWQPRGTVARWIVLVAMTVNLVASLALALVLRDATAAGGGVAERTAFLVAHPIAVPVAWYSWIVASFGLVAIFFTITRAIPGQRALGRLILLLLLLGSVPDICNNLIGAAILPELAEQYVTATGPLKEAIAIDFITWDRFSVLLTGVLGNFFYGLAGFALALAMRRTPDMPRPLVWLSLPLWTATLGIVVASVVDSVPLLIGSVAITMTLFCIWCTGIALTYLGRTA